MTPRDWIVLAFIIPIGIGMGIGIAVLCIGLAGIGGKRG